MKRIHVPASVRVSHGFPPVIDSTSRILILGSFPSVRSRQEDFFYMHPRNRFWPMMDQIFGDLPADRNPQNLRQWLRNHGFALYDVVESCLIRGSADGSLRDVELADIRSLVSRYPIETILLNGQTAGRFFEKGFPDLLSRTVCLPSTSPANARTGLMGLCQRWKPYLLP
ncbi:MAG TPA: DNA-deoxyinosine glycosylase [Candidatus Izemoplasmatales bacterium]|nr:DNA-deoxyinosine glycosylase [Candidatus Izemoplasmatales bacterium]